MTIPVPAVLDLWSLGHSGAQIADMLDLHRSHVGRVVEQARSIGDPRAAVHVTAAHLPTGNVRRVKALLVERPDIEVVPLISRRKSRLKGPRTHCRKGLHPYTAENIKVDHRGNRNCRECFRAARRLKRAAK